MKNVLIVVAIVLLIAGGTAYYLLTQNNEPVDTEPEENIVIPPVNTVTPQEDNISQQPIEIPEEQTQRGPESVIGKSAGGQNITAYHFGNGEQEVMFIGGIHGGYSWNTALLAYEMIDWLKQNPNVVPSNVTITVIPALNPDGLKKVTGTTAKFSSADVSTSNEVKIAGRFNANNVDLNRNFDCEWKSVGTWQNKEVSGGTTAFSEPESQAIRNYVTTNKPTAVITWYSAAGGVYSSSCKNGILPETKTLTNLFATAAKYPAYEEFDYYEITGDMVNWLAGQNIPAISVLLTTREQTEWSKNKAGIEAVLKHYAE